mmetsp:Transcript_18475/g.25688  ORF Transcript_18475/g.25688 Transcript_18475/m.25688 type:complete len:233 (+) Transcript_18475:198-896(+)|eukprot:CAMPEP_0184480568 /NCGR_PEP_ID=MMETSP0113_2-20130426/2057_1 /TAXON_ID=91329 /ORGANISM="Norrisiella sphaerica, Strain BC52" /LENGTH=232 /DNA_ID=CAMNT_0026859113 /DNA_START=109 /DNA_END=807 /DNA_ORIENTATION=+
MGCGASTAPACDNLERPNSNESKLRFGILHSDADFIQDALEEDPSLLNSPISVPEKNISPLEYAASLGHSMAMKQLLAKGADIKGDGKHLLTSAIDSTHARFFKEEIPSDRSISECVKLLLDAKCAVDAKDEGLTPLQRACKRDLHLTVNRLLERKADVNVKNEKNQNLIHLIALGAQWASVVHSQVLGTLMKSGLDPCAEDCNANTYLDLLEKPAERDAYMLKDASLEGKT